MVFASFALARRATRRFGDVAARLVAWTEPQHCRVGTGVSGPVSSPDSITKMQAASKVPKLLPPPHMNWLSRRIDDVERA